MPRFFFTEMKLCTKKREIKLDLHVEMWGKKLS